MIAGVRGAGAPAPPPFGTTVPGNRWDQATGSAPTRTVTVVVLHYDQPAQLQRTLAALRRQTRPADQVVVADDGSATRPEPGDGVEVVRQPDRGFRAAATRNLGAARATGDLLVFLDADTTPEPGFLEHITRLPGRLPELLAVGRRRHADLSAAPVGVPVEEAGPAGELPEPGWLRQGYAETRELRDADATSHRFVISSVLACSRWWFEQIGGFDERFVGYGGEDWELAARSWRQGGLVAHVPDAVAWHDGPAAGEDGRTVDRLGAAALAQTVAVAERVGAPGATYRGLLHGPADLVVTVDAGLDRRELLVTLDSLLAALPTCRIVLEERAATGLPHDPRIVDSAEAASAIQSSARLHLHLARPVHGSVAAWAEVARAADHADAAATTRLVLGSGPVGVVQDLRLHRRARRWNRPDLLTETEVAVRLADAGRTSLQAWWEGWA